MANVGYVNKAVQAMYGKLYSELTPEEKRILHADSVRRAKLIEEREKAVLQNNLKAFEDEAKLEKVLASIYKDCQKQILADVTDTLAKVKKAGGTWSYANQSALTRSKGLFEQITEELTKLGQKEQIAFTQGLSNIYTDQFLRQVYELGQTMSVKANFNRLNPALVKATLDYPWSGAMFSDRLWLDKETLGRNLRVGLTQSMILGEGIPEITDRISKGIETSRSNAERIARTETKRVTYVAHDHAYEDMGVEELKYYTSGMKSMSRVCDICNADKDKIFKRGEEPTLPRHPNCKCIYVPHVADTFKDNELNELTHSVRGAENYNKWIEANKDKINPDGSLKDGWVRDWKNGGKLVNTNPVAPVTPVATTLKNAIKNDKDTVSRAEEIKLTDYPQPFYASKAEAKNTQALLDFINNAEGADPEVVALYKALDKAYNLDENGIDFKISHGKNHAVNWTGSRLTGKMKEVKLVIPKLSGENIIGAVDTTLHEEMHLLDLLLSKSNRDGGKYGTWVSSGNDKLMGFIATKNKSIGDKISELFKAYDDECKKISKELNERFSTEQSKLLKQFLPNGLYGSGGDYKGYKKAVSKLKSTIDEERDYLERNAMGGGIHNLEDIYDALSGGYYREKGVVRYGHGKAYYTRDTSRAHEILANYGTLAVAHPELLNLLTEDKPELVTALREVVKEMLQEVK